MHFRAHVLQLTVGIACLSEVPLPNFNIQRIQLLRTGESFWIYCNGPEGNIGLRDVVLSMKNLAHSFLISWERITPRLAMTRFGSTSFIVANTAFYTPILQSGMTVKGSIQNDLQGLADGIPRYDHLLILGSPQRTRRWTQLWNTGKNGSRSVMQEWWPPRLRISIDWQPPIPASDILKRSCWRSTPTTIEQRIKSTKYWCFLTVHHQQITLGIQYRHNRKCQRHEPHTGTLSAQSPQFSTS